jgi:hypothetical protein
VKLGLEIEFDDRPDPTAGTLRQVLEGIFQKIETSDMTVVIALDELAEMLLAVAKQEEGQLRVEHLLHWLRYLRQTYRHRVKWIFLGSIGLDSFVEDRQLGKTINDLTRIGLDAFTPAVADDFLARLGQDNHLPLDEGIRSLILQKVGWPLPDHLQLFFHSLRDLGCPQVTQTEVERAWVNLLRPENFGHFDTWRQRLEEKYNKFDAIAAKRILTHLCQHSGGCTRHQIHNALMKAQPGADPDVLVEQVAKLLLDLARDGYLLEATGKYAFRSFLLREYWYRREVR